MEIRNLPINKIDPPSYQPREASDPRGLEELAASIKELGLLQPIVVVPHGERYVLVAGSRRLAAAKILGWESIPASIQPAEAHDLALMSLTENLSRVDLHPMETARTIHHLITDVKLSRVEIAAVFGYDVRWVTEQLRLLEMPNYLQEAVELGVLGKSVALELNRIPDDHLKEMYVAYAVQGGCTLKTAGEWVRQATATKAAQEHRQAIARETPPEIYQPPPAPEQPRCWICLAPDTRVILATVNLCYHCQEALKEKP